MRKRNINYLENNIRTSIINDVKTVAIYHSRRYKDISAGHFGIPRQVFCYVDYLGFVAFGGRSSTKRAEKFIKKYFPSNYHPFAELLYSMWRHGTVHEYEPKCYYLDLPGKQPERISVKWFSNNSSKKLNRKENMKIHSMQGKARDLYLVVNICQLVDDLLFALDSLISRMKTDKNYKKECEVRLNQLGGVKEYTEIRNQKGQNGVKKQIELAWNTRAGEIDHSGTVIRRYHQGP